MASTRLSGSVRAGQVPVSLRRDSPTMRSPTCTHDRGGGFVAAGKLATDRGAELVAATGQLLRVGIKDVANVAMHTGLLDHMPSAVRLAHNDASLFFRQ